MAAASIEPFVLAQRPNEANETALTVFGYEHAVPKVRGDVALQQVLLHAVEGAQPVFQVPVEPLSAMNVGAEPADEPPDVANAPVHIVDLPQPLVPGLVGRY